jgi:anti-sigma factor RsiW
VAKQEKHLTTEQLSAFLDGQISEQEQAKYKAHLDTCEQCQYSLITLRETVAFLKALPQPKLSRSFELPAGKTQVIQPQHQVGRVLPLQPGRGLPQRQLPAYIPNILRIASSIAAVLGIVFLLSSFSFHAGSNTGSATTTSAPTTGQTNSRGNQADATPSAHYTPGAQPSVQTPAPSPSAVIANNKFSNHSDQTKTLQPQILPDVSTANGRAEIGLILLVLGVLGLFLLRWLRRLASYP